MKIWLATGVVWKVLLPPSCTPPVMSNSGARNRPLPVTRVALGLLELTMTGPPVSVKAPLPWLLSEALSS